MTLAKILFSCALFTIAVFSLSAQTKITISGSCAKATVEQSVPAGDQPGHVFMVAQGKCTTKGKLAGATSKEGAFSEHRDVTPNHFKAWGVYIETYDSGDKITYTYQMSLAMKDGSVQSGKGTYQVMGGTGKMKDIKGMGNCMYNPGPDGATDYTCTGNYTLAGAAPVAK